MAAPAIVEVVVQKTSHDCAIASLAMLLSRSYREVSEAALTIAPRPHKAGMWTTEIVQVARKLGVRLTKVPLDEEGTGVLVVRKKDGTSHVVLLFQGVIVDPSSGLLYDLDTYLKSSHYQVRGFLVI